MDRPARSRLAPRLVLIVGVLACVFGWGHSVAAAASSAEPPAQPSIVLPTHAGSGADNRAAHRAPQTSDATAERAVDEAAHGHADEQGDAGNGSSHDHSVSCMASSATAAFGSVAAPDVAALVVSATPPQIQLPQWTLHPAEQRAPDLAIFCVLRT